MTNYIIVDLGYGDSGKGNIVDFLTRQKERTLIVRYNGGSQCAHNVHTPYLSSYEQGRHHTFAQFGSGSLYSGKVYTHLSKHMLVDPITLLNEHNVLKEKGFNIISRLSVDEDAIVITPFHRAYNKLSAELGATCGMGIGATREDANKGVALRVRDLSSPNLRNKLRQIQESKQTRLWSQTREDARRDTQKESYMTLYDEPAVNAIAAAYEEFIDNVKVVSYSYLSRFMDEVDQTIFEGAQGVLLDETYGFQPYTTWTDTTTKNAEKLLLGKQATKIGVIRTFMTRHGKGPLVSETNFDISKHEDNMTNMWQGGFRVGYMDLVALKYAAKVCPVDYLAITWEDYLRDTNTYCDAYVTPEGSLIHSIEYAGNLEKQTELTKKLLTYGANLRQTNDKDYISKELNIPVMIRSKGQTYVDKKIVS